MKMNVANDFARLTAKLRDEGRVDVEVQATGTEEENCIYGLATKGLMYINQYHLDSTVHLVLTELLHNAEEALIKRLFLKESGKSSPVDAATLRSFRSELEQNRKQWQARLKKQPASMRVRFEISKHDFSIIVINAGIPDRAEQNWIQSHLAYGARHLSLEALDEGELNTTQGDGFGLTLSMIALRQAGISAELFTYAPEKDRTVFRLDVPVHLIMEDQIQRIDRGLIREIQDLPAFPEHIARMRDACNSDTASLGQVANIISRDQVVAGQVIRLANSGGFAGGRIADLENAVKVVGLKNIAQLLLNIGTINILKDRYGSSDILLKHPPRVGYFSRALARLHKKSVVADHAFVAGLLHDIGKVVLMARMKGRQTFKLAAAHRDRRTRVQLEEMAMGAGHALIGALLAKKWQYPDILIHAIQQHHTPLGAEAEFKDIVFIVYLANALSDFLDGETSFYAVEPDVLDYFNMTTANAFAMTASTLNQEFMERDAYN